MAKPKSPQATTSVVEKIVNAVDHIIHPDHVDSPATPSQEQVATPNESSDAPPQVNNDSVPELASGLKKFDKFKTGASTHDK